MKQLNDQYFNYRQTPVDYDGVAKPSIKGNTLVWNQLCNDTTGQLRCTVTVSNHVFTITENRTEENATFVFRLTNIFVPTGHKVLVLGNFVSQTVTGFSKISIGFVDSSYSGASNSYDVTSIGNFGNIFTTTKDTVRLQFMFSGTSKTGTTDNAVISNIGIFDLTAMFDSGSEPTIEEFKSLFPLPFYAYNSGSLLNFNGTGIKVANADQTIESTLSLPISTYFPTGMKSAGSVYDELSDKAITRVESVDLGTLNWYTTTDENRFNSTDIKSLIKAPSSSTVVANITSTVRCTTYGDLTSKTGEGIGVNGNAGANLGIISLRDTSVSSVEDLVTKYTGVYLNYELETYTEQSAEDIYYNFYINGTEQLLPVNTDAPSTSPLLADIIYYNLTDSEVPYRVFWMINSKGERWDFTDREFKSFLNNPQGLGFSKTFSVNRYGNVQNLTDITDNFPQPNGEVLFYDSSNSTRYDKYNSFVKFLSYEPITLYYKIPVSYYSRIPNTYSIECVVGTLTKTESKTDNILNCSITFNALSFYKGEEVVINGAIAGTGYFHVKNDGDFPVGFEIMATGSVSNPVVTLKQDDELYGEAKFIDATAFSKVYINSNDGEQNVILEQGGSAVPNPMSYQDLSISNGSIYVTFIKLARGESTIMIDGTAGSFTSATIRFTPIYRSV